MPTMSLDRFKYFHGALLAADKHKLILAKADKFRAAASQILPGWDRR